MCETEVCLDFYLARKVRKAFLNGMKMTTRGPLKIEAGEEMGKKGQASGGPHPRGGSLQGAGCAFPPNSSSGRLGTPQPPADYTVRLFG